MILQHHGGFTLHHVLATVDADLRISHWLLDFDSFLERHERFQPHSSGFLWPQAFNASAKPSLVKTNNPSIGEDRPVVLQGNFDPSNTVNTMSSLLLGSQM